MGKTESFLPYESIQIFYNLDDESKRDMYYGTYIPPNPRVITSPPLPKSLHSEIINTDSHKY